MERDANKVKGLSRRHYLSQPWGLSSKNLSDINIKGFSSRSQRYKRVLPMRNLNWFSILMTSFQMWDPGLPEASCLLAIWKSGNLACLRQSLPLAIFNMFISALWFAAFLNLCHYLAGERWHWLSLKLWNIFFQIVRQQQKIYIIRIYFENLYYNLNLYLYKWYFQFYIIILAKAFLALFFC